jgi:hypothetical protein
MLDVLRPLRVAIVALAAIYAAAAIAPSLAGATGKGDAYVGTVEPQTLALASGPYVVTGRIEFTLRSKSQKHGSRRIVQKSIFPLGAGGLYAFCAEGGFAGDSTNGDLGGGLNKVSYKFRVSRKGNFSASDPEESNLRVSGRVSKGHASGTIRYGPFTAEPGGSCDSGPLTWTADKNG